MDDIWNDAGDAALIVIGVGITAFGILCIYTYKLIKCVIKKYNARKLQNITVADPYYSPHLHKIIVVNPEYRRF